jgi:hypothetical protein
MQLVGRFVGRSLYVGIMHLITAEPRLVGSSLDEWP